MSNNSIPLDGDGGLWVFGYGSLVWRPAFTHAYRVPGHIKGWKRRFWQGSTDHRGVPGAPGRVVTLLPWHISVEDDVHAHPDSIWGMCYKIASEDVSRVLDYLDYREKGGYTRTTVDVTLHHDHPEYSAHLDFYRTNGSELPKTITALLYTANEENEEYLGPASIDSIAQQIARSKGPSGPNCEYLFELGKALSLLEAEDRHVVDLVKKVQFIIDNQ